VRGFEINFSQQLSAYASWLKGFQVFANYTELETEGNSTYGGTAQVTNVKAPLEAFVPITYNAGFTYNHRGLRLSLKYNYKGQYLENLGEMRWWKSRGVFDFYGSYDIYKRHAVFVDIKNLGNQPLDKFEGTGYRTRFYEIQGATINVGIKGTF
jgi:outer membrane receptor protein involved in Fe transport